MKLETIICNQKTCKTKRIYTYNLWDENRSFQRAIVELVCVCVGNLLLGIGPAFKCVLSESLQGKSNCSFTDSYQLVITTVLGMENWVYFPSQHWDLIWLWLHAVAVSTSMYICLCVEELFIYMSYMSTSSSNLSAYSSAEFPDPWRSDVIEISYLALSTYLPKIWLCIFFYLLPEEVYLTITDQDNDLWK